MVRMLVIPVVLLALITSGCSLLPAAVVPTTTSSSATVPGTSTIHRVVVHGVGRPGGPSRPRIAAIRREARAVGLPSPRAGLDSQVRYLSKLFGRSLREPGGLTRNAVFAALRRQPTARELRLVALVPADVRLSWGIAMTDAEIEDLQLDVVRRVHAVSSELTSTPDPETEAITVTYRLRRGIRLTPASVARRVVSGTRLPVAVTVIDAGRLDAVAGVPTGSPPRRARNGSTLLVADHVPLLVAGVGIGSTEGFVRRPDGCIGLGSWTVIAPVGSSIDPDGGAFTVPRVGRYRIGTGRPVSLGGVVFERAPRDLLPDHPPCGSPPYLLLG